MKKYIFTNRRGVEIFDLLQVNQLLGEAINFLIDITQKKLPVIVVGTQPALKDLVKNFAENLKFNYVIERWLGGTLTNFKTIFKRIDYFKKIKSDKAAGKLDKYTKKERLMIDRQIVRMSQFFSGLENLTQTPAAIIVFDAKLKNHQTAVREARRLKIPVVAIINSDNDPEEINYPIPANNRARSSVAWILSKIERECQIILKS